MEILTQVTSYRVDVRKETIVTDDSNKSARIVTFEPCFKGSLEEAIQELETLRHRHPDHRYKLIRITEALLDY